MRRGADRTSRPGLGLGFPGHAWRRGHLRHRGLQDRVTLAGRKGGPRRAVVAVVGVGVRYPDALPLGELLAERGPVLRHLADPPGALAPDPPDVAQLASVPLVCCCERLRCRTWRRLRPGRGG